MLEPELFALLEQTADAAYSVTEGGEICSWNGAAERLFGYPASDVLGRNIDEVLQARDTLGTSALAGAPMQQLAPGMERPAGSRISTWKYGVDPGAGSGWTSQPLSSTTSGRDAGSSFGWPATSISATGTRSNSTVCSMSPGNLFRLPATRPITPRSNRSPSRSVTS